MKFYSAALLILLTFSAANGQSCSSFAEQIETAFIGKNPELLDWSTEELCTQEQLYRVNYLKGKCAFYLGEYDRSKHFFESALALGGSSDEDILMFLNEIGTETRNDSLVALTESRLTEKLPETLQGSEGGDASQLRFVSKTAASNQPGRTPLLMYNTLTGSLNQKLGGLRVKESLGFQLRSNLQEQFLDGIQASADLQLIYRTVSFSAGYSFGVSYDSVNTVNPFSGHLLISHDFSPVPGWSLAHSALGYRIDSSWILFDLSQTHTVELSRTQELMLAFSYENNSISPNLSDTSISLLNGIIGLTPQVRWQFESGKNRWRVQGEYCRERESSAVITDSSYIDYMTALELGVPVPQLERTTEYRRTSTLQGYGAFRRSFSPFALEIRIGGGSEYDGGWTPFWNGRLDFSVTL